MSYFIDVQGTLIDDEKKQPIEGSIAFIDKLNAQKIPYVVVTNNTKFQSEAFHRFLCDLGFAIPKTHYLDPFMTLEFALQTKNVKSFGAQEFLDTMHEMGYAQTQEAPEAIVIASKKDFDANEYADMIELSLQGAKIIGMHATSIYAKDKRRYPGVGAILEMLRYATAKDYAVVGKPSTLFYQAGLNLLRAQGLPADFCDVTMISDDAIGDLLGAKALGMKSILVLSGKCQSEHEVAHMRGSLDKIAENIGKIEDN